MKLAGLVAPTILIVVTATADGPSLPAPKLLSPESGHVFHTYPRHTVVAWEPVPGAVAYSAEVDCQYNGTWASEDGHPQWIFRTVEPKGEFDFVGAQPGRWRVWAIRCRWEAGREE